METLTKRISQRCLWSNVQTSNSRNPFLKCRRKHTETIPAPEVSDADFGFHFDYWERLVGAHKHASVRSRDTKNTTLYTSSIGSFC
ncbi:hypothetical protein TNCV_4353691 [Trichonephila clavipes]|nr:hypothetical protein TNCV_4353691 [Trichonephila clavipes]